MILDNPSKIVSDKPDFEPEINPDYDWEICIICERPHRDHTTKEMVECSFEEVSGVRS